MIVSHYIWRCVGRWPSWAVGWQAFDDMPTNSIPVLAPQKENNRRTDENGVTNGIVVSSTLVTDLIADLRFAHVDFE